MAGSLGDLLNNSRFSEPPEINKIKKFVQEHIDQTPKVRMTGQNFIVYIEGASAANALRFQIFRLQRSFGNTHKIIIKII